MYQESVKDCTLPKEFSDGISRDDGGEDKYVKDAKTEPSQTIKELELLLEKKEEQLKEQTKAAEEIKVSYVLLHKNIIVKVHLGVVDTRIISPP